MGMDLRGAGGNFRFNHVGWGKVLQLARIYGWEPAGTEAPAWEDPDTGEVDTYDDWPGGYFSNDYQGVTDQDAAGIADAIECALPDVPAHNARWHKEVVPVPSLPDLRGIPLGAEAEINPFEWFSGEGRDRLREFIVYCRAGAFCIG